MVLRPFCGMMLVSKIKSLLPNRILSLKNVNAQGQRIADEIFYNETTIIARSMSNWHHSLNMTNWFFHRINVKSATWFEHHALFFSRNRPARESKSVCCTPQLPLSPLSLVASITDALSVWHFGRAIPARKPGALCAQCFNLLCFSFEFGICCVQRCTNQSAVIAAHFLEKRLQQIERSRGGQSRSHGYLSRPPSI